MIRAMLVDDEPMTRSGLRRFVDWERLGIEIVGEAEDGMDALDRFVALRPDIVLSDVRMPRMDGIALAHRIRGIDPRCKLIFLSGYNDVDYLKLAIKLQAVDYMLKPVQMPELSALLERIAGEIAEERANERELQELREQYDRSQPERQERLVKTLLGLVPAAREEYESALQELGRLESAFPVTGYYQCAVFRFRDEAARSRWREEAVSEANAAQLPVLTAVIDGLGVACAAIPDLRRDDGLDLWLNRLTRRGNGEERSGVVAGIGEAVSQLSGCHESYRQAVESLVYRFYRGWHTVIRYKDLPQDSRQSRLFDKQALIRFETLLRGKQLGEAGKCLDETINELLLYTPAEVGAVREKLFRWYVALTRIYPEAMWEFENDRMWASMFVSGELFTIRKYMMQQLGAIREALEHPDSSDKTVIRDIIRFIQEHYGGDVSINTLAAHVHLAPTYMCILFKKEKGLSINDYITQYRIGQAKLLLRDRRMKLYEVAAKVGYQDANYFAKVFRKMTGVIPSRYRDTLLEP